MKVSDEDDVVQDTAAHSDQVDGVGLLVHRCQDATEPLTQNSKGILHDIRHETTCSCICFVVGLATDGGMVSSSRFGEHRRHPLQSDKTLAGYH